MPLRGGCGILRRLRTQGVCAVSEEMPVQSPRGTALDTVGGVLGLVVFLAGIGLLVVVFMRASRLYEEIGPAIESARVASSEGAPAVTASPAGKAAPAVVVARPGGKPLSKIGAEFGLKFLWLIAQGLLAALVAAMGAKLAGAYRGRRT